MKLPDIDEHGTPQQLLDGLNAYINAAHALLDEKNMVDLAGLDAVVDILCARVLKMPPEGMMLEDQKHYIEMLDGLHTRLGALQEKMIATQAALKLELEQSNARQKASRAYLKDKK